MARSRWLGVSFSLVAMAVAASIAWLAPARGDDAAPSSKTLPANRGLMQRVSNFTLKDAISGREVTLHGFIGKKAIVIVFLGTDCPVGNLYLPRLVELEKSFGPRGVVFLGVNSNASDSLEAVAKHAREYGLTFPVLKDVGNVVADSALVERTCETLVLDGFCRLRYRGAIDDQYTYGKAKDRAVHNFLQDALEAMVAGKPIKVTATEVAGCVIERAAAPANAAARQPRIRGLAESVAAQLDREESAHPIDVGQVTYAGAVADLLARKCQSCHRPGQVAPFSLLSYDDARRKAGVIREAVEDRRMPPWHADPHFGHFKNDRGLTPRERATLLAWLDQGTALGDPSALPKPTSFSDGWTIGKPDVVFEIPEPYYVPAQGVVDYVHFKVPTGWKEDRFIQAAEAVPGDRTVVHHIIVYLLDPNKKKADGRPDLVHFCAYAPGDLPTKLPDGVAKRIPAGSDLLFQIHYTPNGKIRNDRSKVGFVFAKTPPKREAYTIPIANLDFIIPPRANNVAVSASFTLEADARLLSFLPHMHLRGKDFKYTVTLPGQKPVTVLSVPAYDFAWQSYYIFESPMDLPRGTRIDCLAHFDNSAANPYNPDPNATIHWGEQTFEEMMIGFVDLDVPAGAGRPQGPELASRREKATITALRTVRRLVSNEKSSNAAGASNSPAKGSRP